MAKYHAIGNNFNFYINCATDEQAIAEVTEIANNTYGHQHYPNNIKFWFRIERIDVIFDNIGRP